jgi:hypothetical protein
MTSDVDWGPTSYYVVIIEDIEQFHDVSVPDLFGDNFDQYGEYPHRTVAIDNLIMEDELFDADEFVVIEDVAC